ncbi:MAG: hypothetical protein CVV02_14265 [Firmicutes bacterium HGW-Firmicutes-7]|nr:MAG: hypothetical protein CVV02_14265 [Firmicutes bacterium HGW-Firmicutes-7]
MNSSRFFDFNTAIMFQSLIHIFVILLYLLLIGLLVYCLILFIKVARRGIVALDIYNSKNRGDALRDRHSNE